MENWEANSEKDMLCLLVGDWYGDDPENNLNMIRQDKAQRASWLCQELEMNMNSRVLEIGSGMGFTSKHVANRVNQLYCCDISQTFLTQAQRECRDAKNISFYRIEEQGKLPFPDDFFDCAYSDAVFIHLNLYDIFWYLSVFKRVVKPNGIVWFNVMNTSPGMMDKLVEMATYYRKDSNCLQNLLCWNSHEAVVNVAQYFGFELVYKDMGENASNVNFKFKKTAP
jgi:ubiquinone/menaquinone biosynthesis C-methylase UbiE